MLTVADEVLLASKTNMHALFIQHNGEDTHTRSAVFNEAFKVSAAMTTTDR
jgi:hypothetical protein